MTASHQPPTTPPPTFLRSPSAEKLLRLGWGLVLFGMISSPPKCLGEQWKSSDFEQRIAPLLAAHCLECHNETMQEGGLDLTAESTAREGGDSGSALDRAEGEESLLWQRIRDNEMPPEDPLSDSDKESFKDWIAAGAPWGQSPIDRFRYSSEYRAGYDWWSLQPLADITTLSVIPNEAQSRANRGRVSSQWARNEIDHFILAKLASAGLQPSPRVDSRSLLRRLYFDVIGLPPTIVRNGDRWHEQILGIDIDLDNFGKDPQEYKQVVDQLLDSPHYGERWARHWFDVIRFGESQGFERNRIRENAWRYRDWVVSALNRDLPYDEFIRQQIAGDALYPDDLNALLATGFLVSGTWDQVGHNEGSREMQKGVREEELEDIVGTVGQTFLGLTTNCARCHDHKFDPISQRDYYRFAALLGGVTQQEKERSGIQLKSQSEQHTAWSVELNSAKARLAQLESKLRDRYGKTQTATAPSNTGLLALYFPAASQDKLVTDRSDSGASLDLHLADQQHAISREPATKIIAAIKRSEAFGLELWLTPSSNNQSGPARIVTLSQDTGQRNFTLGQDGTRLDLRLRTTERDGNGLPSVSTPDGLLTTTKQHVVVTRTKDGEVTIYLNGKSILHEQVDGSLANWNDDFRLALGNEVTGDRPWQGAIHRLAIFDRALSESEVSQYFKSDSKTFPSYQPIEALLSRATPEQRDQYRSAITELRALQAMEPADPFAGVAHVIIPQQPPVFHVLARGNHQQPLDEVAPAALSTLDQVGLSSDFGLAKDSPEGERRKALAAWISDPRNPLTARVIVNRLWHYHFGTGIVDTPSDFGFSGGKPSHPELLDWLANELVRNQWSLKSIHRKILLSATWQQASIREAPEAEQIDRDNRLLWRATLQRLDGEAVRDAMLAVSGELNLKLGGPSYRDVAVKLGNNHEFTEPTGEFNADVNRRTIYRLWARSGNNTLLESLDCPDPSVMISRRSQTITPVQSLALLNHRFVEQCAASLAKLCRQHAPHNAVAEVHWLYQRLYLRNPQQNEFDIVLPLLREHGLEQLCLVLLNSNEFLFLQ